MKHKTYILALLLLLVPTWMAAQEALNGYLETAAKNNPGLQASFNAYLASLEKAPQVSALPDPQIAFAYFIQPVETRLGPQQFKISASQFFPWFGTLNARENMVVQQAKAKYEAFEEEKSRLFREVKAEYFNLYLNRKSIAILGENIELLKSLQQLATVKMEAGLVSMADEYRIKMEINDLENQLALLKDKQAAMEVSFRNLLNVEDIPEIRLPEDLWTGDLGYSRQAALDSIKAGNHQLLQLEFRQAALAAEKNAAQKKGMPGLKIGLDYTFIGEGSNNLSGKDAFVFPSVGISIPLYRNKYKAMVQEVVYLETANKSSSSEKMNRLESLFQNNWKNYRDADRRIALNREQEKLARQSLNILESEYATGNSDFEELLRMERKLLNYQLALEKAKADKQAAIAFIHYLMGR